MEPEGSGGNSSLDDIPDNIRGKIDNKVEGCKNKYNTEEYGKVDNIPEPVEGGKLDNGAIHKEFTDIPEKGGKSIDNIPEPIEGGRFDNVVIHKEFANIPENGG